MPVDSFKALLMERPRSTKQRARESESGDWQPGSGCRGMLRLHRTIVSMRFVMEGWNGKQAVTWASGYC